MLRIPSTFSPLRMKLVASGNRSVGHLELNFRDKEPSSSTTTTTSQQTNSNTTSTSTSSTKAEVSHLEISNRTSFWFRNSHTCRLCGSVYLNPKEHFHSGVDARHHVCREMFIDYFLAEDAKQQFTGTRHWMQRLQRRRLDSLCFESSNNSSSNGNSNSKKHCFEEEKPILTEPINLQKLKQRRESDMNTLSDRCKYLCQVFGFLRDVGILKESFIPSRRTPLDIVQNGAGRLYTKSARNRCIFERLEYTGDSLHGFQAAARLLWLLPHREWISYQYSWAWGIMRDFVESNDNLTRLAQMMNIDQLLPDDVILGGGKPYADVLEAVIGELNSEMMRLTSCPSSREAVLPSSIAVKTSSSASTTSEEKSTATTTTTTTTTKIRRKPEIVSGVSRIPTNSAPNDPLWNGTVASPENKALIAVIKFALDELADLMTLCFAFTFCEETTLLPFARELLHSKAIIPFEPTLTSEKTQRVGFLGKRLRRSAVLMGDSFTFFELKTFSKPMKESEFDYDSNSSLLLSEKKVNSNNNNRYSSTFPLMRMNDENLTSTSRTTVSIHELVSPNTNNAPRAAASVDPNSSLYASPLVPLAPRGKHENITTTTTIDATSFVEDQQQQHFHSKKKIFQQQKQQKQQKKRHETDKLPSTSWLSRCALKGTFSSPISSKIFNQAAEKLVQELSSAPSSASSSLHNQNNNIPHSRSKAVQQHEELLLRQSAALQLFPEPINNYSKSDFGEVFLSSQEILEASTTKQYSLEVKKEEEEDKEKSSCSLRRFADEVTEYAPIDTSRIFDTSKTFETNTGFIPKIVFEAEARRQREFELRKKMRQKRQI